MLIKNESAETYGVILPYLKATSQRSLGIRQAVYDEPKKNIDEIKGTKNKHGVANWFVLSCKLTVN